MRIDAAPILLVYGGGRWARQVVTVLLGMELPFHKVVIVSKINATAMQSLIDSKQRNHCEYSIIPDLNHIDRIEDIKAALIISSARTHMCVAQRLISLGVDVFIEKPFVLKRKEAVALIQSASLAKVTLYPGFQYRFCSYIHHFASYLESLGEITTHISLQWSDSSNEKRYGETKNYDYSLNVAEDIMPHVWSILDSIFKDQDFAINRCAIESGGRVAEFEVQSTSVTGVIVLERDALTRQRILEVTFDSGKKASIDFSSEPGTITDIDGRTRSADSNWTELSRPLAKQLRHFFNLEPLSINRLDADAMLQSVVFCEDAAKIIKSQQKELLSSAIRNKRHILENNYLALREVLAEDMIRLGLVNAADNAGLEAKVKEVGLLIVQEDLHSLEDVLQRLELM